MSLPTNLNSILANLPHNVKLCAVSKFQPIDSIKELYAVGHRVFGESRPQELAAKAEVMVAAGCDDVQWHFIGHLQTNKVSLVVPVVTLIESVDSERLLAAISREAVKIGRTVEILLQVHIAEEQTKQGFSDEEVREIMNRPLPENILIKGLMGMATYTDDKNQVAREFETLHSLYLEFPQFKILSMGMSGDYQLAISCGSTSVRVGTAIFGAR